MTTNASRAPIDFDAFEREMQSSVAPERPAQPKSDPLAELARIVGQDDPFRQLLESRGKGRPSANRVEPSFDDAPAVHGQAAQSPADAFDQYLASVEQSHRDGAGQDQDPAAFESDDRGYANAATAHPPRRGRLFQVGAGLGVLALCVTGALAYKGMHGSGANGPITVLADKTPLKVAPEKADGVDIPDQNKQIYDRTAKDGQIKIVNREEQPLDVAQAARAASRDSGAQGGTTPGGGLLTESLGEPRRIRTVAVKPDTPPPAMQQQREAQAQAEVNQASPSPIPTMMMPDGSNDAPSRGIATPAAGSARKSATAPVAQPAPVQTAAAQPTETPASDASSARASRKSLKRVASVGEPDGTAPPEAAAAAPAPAPTPTPATTASIGGFSVQLGVRNSEADAHAAFKQMQAKYAQLSGKPELIRQAEVKGQSLYRVRVGPLEKSAATSLCTELKSAGGQCFVAKN